ncbi:MAG: arsenic resistance protein, partial [Deinococcales bacterium]
MNRFALEQHQVWVYLCAIAIGLLVGGLQPALAMGFEALLYPVLAALLYVTFVQVPLLHVRDAFSDQRFVLSILVGNFVLIPLFVWLSLPWLPNDPAVRLGVALVLLVPCTDWFITFA